MKIRETFKVKNCLTCGVKKTPIEFPQSSSIKNGKRYREHVCKSCLYPIKYEKSRK